MDTVSFPVFGFLHPQGTEPPHHAKAVSVGGLSPVKSHATVLHFENEHRMLTRYANTKYLTS